MESKGIKSIKPQQSFGLVDSLGRKLISKLSTKIKVEKGQSKWLKKFVEQMRNK
jgi:hypothetical protein|tara:strand:+ start:7529 stop:7690 length:162 start_codon:yes stop_codon:yes gene_type:complete